MIGAFGRWLASRRDEECRRLRAEIARLETDVSTFVRWQGYDYASISARHNEIDQLRQDYAQIRAELALTRAELDVEATLRRQPK